MQTTYSSQVTPLEKDFIRCSLAKQEQDVRAKKYLQLSILGGLTVVIVIVSTLWKQAESQRQLAVSHNIKSLTNHAELLLRAGSQLEVLKQAQTAVNQIMKEGQLSSQITLPAIASKTKDKLSKVTLWSYHGKFIRTLDAATGIATLTFSQDGEVLLTGNETGELQFWNLAGELLKTMKYSHHGLYEIFKVKFRSGDRELTAVDIFSARAISLNLNLQQLQEQANNWQK
ncbi:hypothetical protein WA1_46360 [Scytonema hofmannii PCC 7110]|uniref:WD40 repeat-containing protein n=1 Tax=Scytonema hofmannii PCC 7110 TaxID=128403 RepID=A0A139WXA1_9CYAN|nr:hypothetical protein [Scytonema hofmannii]KYC37065.1 hypothetical protein WA1_46360 [Scytonema hofmannii PCC 7110]